MVCPKCNSNTIRVLDIVHNKEKNETYRKRKCTKCGHIFFTKESQEERTAEFLDLWSCNHRGKTTKKNNKAFIEMYKRVSKASKEEKEND